MDDSSSSLAAPEEHGFKQTPQKFALLRAALQLRWQKVIDDAVPHRKARWVFTFCLLLVYILRVYFLSGWYIISYALGIYILNLLISFLSPLVDPEADTSDGGVLPTKADDDYKPFVRKLPEFKFWYACTKACLIALVCTFISLLNIPAFWPILLIYFIALFFVTMKRQISHMIKHKYVPFEVGKPKYFAPSEKST